MPTLPWFRAILLLALAVPTAHAITLARYDFTGAGGDQASQAATFSVGPVTAAPITRGPGLTPNVGGNSINSSGWSTAIAVDPDDYYEFTLTPTEGFKLDLERLSFAERRSGTGIRNFQIRTSLDDFATGLDSVPVIVPDDTFTRQYSFEFNNQFLSLAEPVTLRLYGYAAEATGGTWRLENYTGTEGSTGGLTVDGSLSFLGERSTIYLQDLGPDFVPQSGNAQGDIVGYRLSTNQAAVRRANGTLEDLGTLGGSESRATAISDDGSIIVGWAHNASGVQNSFRHEGGTMISVLGETGIPNQSIGLDATGNIYVNRQGGLPSVRRWNRARVSTDTLVNNVQADGVNLDGTFVGKGTSGTAFYNDGAEHTILPVTYVASAGLAESNLSAGSLSNSAAYYRLGDPLAQTIPNITTLGETSNATGVNDHDFIVGNTDATSFFYSVAEGVVIDLNARDVVVSPAFLNNEVAAITDVFIDEVYGITDADVFFGKYTEGGGGEEHGYFRASFENVFPNSLPGDFDLDGDVDGRDFLIWQRGGSPSPLSAGDLVDWQGNYGAGSLAATSVTVPEPASAVLITTFTGIFLFRFKSKSDSP